MKHFVLIVNGWKRLAIITKSSILDVAAVLDPPLLIVYYIIYPGPDLGNKSNRQI